MFPTFLCVGWVTRFVVVAAVIVSTEIFPKFLHNCLNTHKLAFFSDSDIFGSQDGQPYDDCPETILFPNVVWARSKRLLTTQRYPFGVHEVSKEFPACWDFVEWNPKFFGNIVDCTWGRHASCDSSNLLLQEQFRVGCQDSKRVRWSHEEMFAQNHVSVYIRECIPASPSQAAPNYGTSSFLRSNIPMSLTKSSAYVKFGSGWRPPKSGSKSQWFKQVGAQPSSSWKIALA